ncbi:XRE family transcriptional regulator [Tissierella sp.]|uniref:LexA family protein n=1 Tax=Tissierella sp. TaxID=41274 RepID=UPI002862AC15|nr:XRE family transcriptional regulator [Tissierella sp.]MDR7856015.1 XRE family transcriptional regulator [Tissierella sp.]
MSEYNLELGKRIYKARINKEITLKQLGDLVDLSESTVQRYEKGKIKNVDIEMVKKFAKALGVLPAHLLGWEMSDEYNNSITIPVYGSIPAGMPLEAIEDIQGEVDIPVEWMKGNKKYIALKVKGDSMYPKYLEGDTVIILVQPDCETGDDCACYVNGFEATLKTVKKTTGKIELKPINPNYSPRTYNHPGEVKIVGIVKELRRKI